MYNLDGSLEMPTDRQRIRVWLGETLSVSDFWQYLELKDAEREKFEEYVSGMVMLKDTLMVVNG